MQGGGGRRGLEVQRWKKVREDERSVQRSDVLEARWRRRHQAGRSGVREVTSSPQAQPPVFRLPEFRRVGKRRRANQTRLESASVWLAASPFAVKNRRLLPNRSNNEA